MDLEPRMLYMLYGVFVTMPSSSSSIQSMTSTTNIPLAYPPSPLRESAESLEKRSKQRRSERLRARNFLVNVFLAIGFVFVICFRCTHFEIGENKFERYNSEQQHIAYAPYGLQHAEQRTSHHL